MCESFFETLCLENIDHTAWGVALEVVVFLYCFAGLAIVCDEYLVVSLETLCVRFNIREDIAGASFMAFGSAAPEIIINAVATLQTMTAAGGAGGDSSATNLGVSAIIGSGMIAFSAIPGCCGIFASETLHLKRRPLIRDFSTYSAALGFLVYAFSDGVVVAWEAGVMVGAYFLYLAVLTTSPMIRAYYRVHCLGRQRVQRRSFVLRNEEQAASIRASNRNTLLAMQAAIADLPEDVKIESSKRRLGDDRAGNDDYPRRMRELMEGGELVTYASFVKLRSSSAVSLDSPARRSMDSPADLYHPIAAAGTGEAVEDATPPSLLGRVASRLIAPLRLAFSLTCPECHYNTEHAGRYPITFLAAFIWVAVFSVTISAVVSRWAELSGLSMVLFGLLMVALGAEIPDTVQSVTVARRGYGSMAVGNAIGSQIINVLMGLGLPWLIANLASDRPVRVTLHAFLRTAAFFQFGNIGVAALLLLAHTFILRRNKVQLHTAKGVTLVAAYLCTVSGYAAYVLTHPDAAKSSGG